MMNLVNFLATAGTTKCGDIDIPNGVYNIVHLVILLIQIAVPIMLIIIGMIDFAKATVGGDEDKIKAGQKTFLKRIIAAVLVFLVVTAVVLVVNAVGSVGGLEEDNTSTISGCISNFVSGV